MTLYSHALLRPSAADFVVIGYVKVADNFASLSYTYRFQSAKESEIPSKLKIMRPSRFHE